MEELRKRSIKNASEYNLELQNLRKSERKYFYDMQTSVVQSAKNRWFKMSKEQSRPSPYPVALLPGQYCSHYKRLVFQIDLKKFICKFFRFDSEQLFKLPLNTVLNTENLTIPPKRDMSPTPIRVSDYEVESSKRAAELLCEVNFNFFF